MKDKSFSSLTLCVVICIVPNALDDLSHDSPLPIDADPLPHGVSIKPLIRSLKKEIHRLKKKLKKMEDDL